MLTLLYIYGDCLADSLVLECEFSVNIVTRQACNFPRTLYAAKRPMSLWAHFIAPHGALLFAGAAEHFTGAEHLKVVPPT